MRELSFTFLEKYYPVFLEGIKWTISIALVTVIMGVILGSILCLMKTVKVKFFNIRIIESLLTAILRIVSNVYVEIIRGTPLLLQIYLVFFGLPALGVKFGAFTSCVIALSLNSAAYVSEIIRAGIEAVDKGQMEAARSLGMTEAKGMIYIVIPQAIKNILPAIGNEFVAVIKESSMASTIGVAEIMYAVNVVKGATWKSFEPLIVAAVCYFTITFTLGRLLGILERRLKASDSR
ncbi:MULTISPECIES: amino acid ABC transporter permease [Clostridium]|uniref:amino acid ABC transporter permease n=1 Tax=Clostridium TaxID=1485 RepID=UPI000667B2A5|nr:MULTISPECIES: amino acid ABC transporter permease [Clostridium]MBS7131223.1 amino acid ABC transporter permease [Clostridium sp.]MDB2074933.1 amino acid ABC transporter permease [Clostridium paraputrificum]MDB2078284.1 amino acid ABC transporter permease [Clostridium paraputrificum]MDB2091733.1 amino acid ABC transporter permease [Clostridium paraputrificum]MDB2098698.1 amino acid ABC transporter permease [Clostridium paraputrificum]